MKFLAALFLLLSLNVFAQDHMDGDFDSVDSEQIDINGSYANTQKSTAADRLRNYRQKLEKRNEIMIKKKIEMLRYKQEMEMAKRIQIQMNKVYNNMNQQLNNM